MNRDRQASWDRKGIEESLVRPELPDLQVLEDRPDLLETSRLSLDRPAYKDHPENAASSDLRVLKVRKVSVASRAKWALPALPEKTALPVNADRKAIEETAATRARGGRLDRLVLLVLRALAEAVARDLRGLPVRLDLLANLACQDRLASEASAVSEVIWASAA